jgi:molybdenum cofactor cytidylyltransferase
MIVGLLLAAGGARRFKSQKLVAAYRGAPLVVHAARAVRAATDALIAVVGHDAEPVRRALADIGASVVDNGDWESGLASSIRRGVEAMPASAEALVVAVGDQPGLDPAVIRAVTARFRETGVPIVSASYRGVRGHPVLFARSGFPELQQLDGDAGARLLIERSAERVSYVEVDADMPPDVDTIEQLAALDDQADVR